MKNVNGVYIINNQRTGNGSGPLSITLKKYDYFPGEFVEGNVILQLTSPIVLNDIFLTLTISESWNVKAETISAESSDKVVVNHRVGIGNILKINSNLINLNPGKFNFPFKFKLQENFPPIFEYPKNDQRGFLRYILKAQISTYNLSEGTTYLFIKTSPRTLPSPLSFSVPITLKKVGINNGTTVLKTSYKQNYFPIRGTILIDVEIDNSQGKSKVKGINLKLVRRVQYKKVQEAKIRYNLETVISIFSNQIDVPPKTKSQVYHCEIIAKDDTLKTFGYLTYNSNPYPRLNDLLYAMPSINSYSIKCNYFIVATIEFAGLVTQCEANKAIMPIFLYHLPVKQNEPKIIANQINIPKQNINVPQAQPNVVKNNNNINNNQINNNRVINNQINNNQINNSNVKNNLIDSNSNVTINEINEGGIFLNNQQQQNYNITDNGINQNQEINPQQNINIVQNKIYQNQAVNPQQNYKVVENQIHQNQVINPQQNNNIMQNQIHQNQMANPQQNNNIMQHQIHQNQVINPQQNNNIIQNQIHQNQVINSQQNNNIMQNQIHQNQMSIPQQNNNIIQNEIQQNQMIQNEVIKQERSGENIIDNDDNNEFNLLNNVNEENKMIIATAALSLAANNINNEEENNQKILAKKKMKKIEFISNVNNNNINLQSNVNNKKIIVNIKKYKPKGHVMFTLFDY